MSRVPVYSIAPSHDGRNLQLDLLRFVAILGVLFRHLILFTKPNRWDALPIRAGWAGVDLFFVLSGFLVSGLLFGELKRTGGIRWPRFLLRRMMRIYPAFYFLVLLTVGVRLWESHGRNARVVGKEFGSDLLFLQSYTPGSWGHFWSLSVEEHFYLLLPLMLFLLLRSGRLAWLPATFLITAVAALAGRLLTARLVPFSWQTHLYPTHLRIDSLFFGVLLAYYAHFDRERFEAAIQKNRTLLACVGIALLLPCVLFDQYDRFNYTFGFTCLYLGFGCMLCVALRSPPPKQFGIIVPACASVGRYSYSIYLWHIPWLILISRLKLLSSALYLIGAIAAGVVAARCVEVPSQRWRERLAP